jgi:hypothetical protein
MTIKRYAGDKLVGLSSDTKPTNLPDGATFYETDTLNQYIRSAGSWNKVANTTFENININTSGLALSNSTANVAFFDSDGNVGINTTTSTAKLDINSDVVRLRVSKTPSSATDAGNQGDICWDSNYIYVCVSSNTWVRATLSTW